jgi:hypothetical protein
MDRLDDLARDDPDRFPRVELERWYLAGGLNGSARVRGRVLNQILHVVTYRDQEWYVITPDGVSRWE